MIKRLNLQFFESFVLIFINMATQFLLLTNLSVIGFSEYTLAILFINGGTAVFDLGLSDQIIRRKSYRKLYPISLIYIFQIYLVFAFCLLGILLYQSTSTSINVYVCFFYLIFIQVLNNYLTYFLRSNLNIKELIFIRLVCAFGLIIIIISIDFTNFLVVIALVSVIETLKLLMLVGYIHGFLHKKIFCPLKYNIRKEIFCSLYTFSYGYHFSRVLSFSTRNIDLYIVSLVATIEEFAAYAVVFRFTRPLIRLIAGNTNKILFPELMKVSKHKSSQLLPKVQLIVFVASVVFFSILGLLLGPLIEFFVDDYRAGLEKFIFPSMFICVSLVQIGIIDTVLKAYASQRDIAKLSIVRLILTVVSFVVSADYSLVVALYTLNVVMLFLYYLTFVVCVRSSGGTKNMRGVVIGIIFCSATVMYVVIAN